MNKLILTVYLILMQHFCHAQHYFYDENYYDSPLLIELGASAGLMNCLTDLQGNNGKGGKFLKDLHPSGTHPQIGFYTEITYNNWLGLRIAFSSGKISAGDSLSGSAQRSQRNLHFRSSIRELICLLEWHPLLMRDPELYTEPLFSPYLAAGIGLYRFNPQALYQNRWIDLASLHTEGQGFREYKDRNPYPLQQVCLPMGAGFRYELSPLMHLRLELIYRLLFTDYLDDVSKTYIDPVLFSLYMPADRAELAKNLAGRKENQLSGNRRGNPANNDAYFSVNFKMGFIINRRRR